MDNEYGNPLGETASVRTSPDPPAGLEPRVVAALRAEGLIRSRSRWAQPARVAASLLIFAAGAVAGHFVSQASFVAPGTEPAQSRYLLLLSGDVSPAADGSSRAAEYGAWARGLAARGIAVSGEELTNHVQVVSNTAARALPDLSSAGGYFLVEARDDEAAAELARTCPHVKYGGSIVVRRIQ